MSIKSYTLKEARFEHSAGTVCYDFCGYTYGLVSDDEYETHQEHCAVTLNSNGDGPFFTVPVSGLSLEKL